MKIISSELYVKDNKVYHEGNKPKPKDIGAAPETHTHNYASATTPGGSAEHAIKATEDSLGQRIDKYIKGLSVSGRTITYTRGDGTTGTITTQDNNTDTKVTNTLNTTAKAYITGTTESATNTGTQVFDTNVYLDTTAGTLTATTFKGALQGNAATATSATSAASATQLATARTINGTSFNGTGNITTANWGTARTLTIGNSGKSVNGSANVTWSLAEIGAAPASHSHASVVMNNCSNKDLNTIKTAGFYYGYTGMTNAPTQAIAVLEVLVYSADWIVQRFTVVGNGGRKYERHFHSGTTWSAWRTLYDSSNKPTPSEIGAAASSHTHNYAGSSSAGGVANSATKLATPRTINGVSFDGTANITVTDSSKVAPTGTITANRIAVFNDTTGKVIKDSGFTIATSVPSNAKFTDTVYTHPNDANTRHVTDSEKATWNAKETTSGSQAKADKALASAKSYADAKVAELVDSSPDTLNTLNELAAALGDDPNFATTVATQIGTKADTTYVNTELAKKANSSHTHNYAGSSSAGGAANSAIKATQDSAGQQINTTYIKGLSVSGKTITYTKGDGTTGTLTTQDTNTTYSTGTASALGLTKLYTGTGTATDGTMTQSAINTALNGKANSSHTHSSLTGTAGSNIAPSTGTGVMRYDYNVSSSVAGTLPVTNNANGVLTLNTHSGNYYNQLGFSSNGNLYYRAFNGVALDTTTAWKQIAFTNSSITGNAATATTLQTARTINGTSFNGSANITTANWGTARTLTIGSTGKSVNGSANITWTLAEIGAAAASHGNHVPATQTADARKFLRNDNTWQSLPTASTSATGIVQLNNTVTSTSTSQAGTANAVKIAYDKGNEALTKANVALTSADNAAASIKTISTTANEALAKANEAFQSGNNVKQELVDALIAKGVDVSTSDSWDTIIGSLGNISSASGANIYAATSLPATGKKDDICIVSSPLPKHIHIGRIKPTSADVNDIWMDTDETNNASRQYRVITFGGLSTNLRVGTCYRFTSTTNASTSVVVYYWNGSKWIAASPTLINIKSPNSTSGSISLGSSSRRDIASSGGISVNFKGYEGVEYTGTCSVRVYHRYNFGSGGSRFTYTVEAFNAAGKSTFSKTVTTNLNDEDYKYIHSVPVVPNGYVRVIGSSAGAYDEFDLYMYAYANKA